MPRKSSKSAESEAALTPNEVEASPTRALTPADPEPQSADADAAPAKPAAKRKSAPKKAAAKKTSARKTAPKKKPAQADDVQAESAVEASASHEAGAAPDSGQAEADAHAAAVLDEAIQPNSSSELQSELEAVGLDDETTEPPAASEEEGEPGPRPPAKLERLQKILAQAGVASRRHAEELITQGRVQVNGQVVTTLGSKADPARDHIRVDGKLLHGAERLRYFMLNTPRGYVTTVSDPEGRPTVMEFFKKAGERLYPVGRLDYLSEGLLLVTNDGELANKLTRAASGVEKAYLVKVSGQPTEDEIESLREGVRIDRTKPGEGLVRTAPARIRQVRIGENPWYEVVLIEGRNRELRKMFEEIGHFVEKIRRVSYGPLVLDLEPGQVRELDAQELNLIRLAADGKWKPKKLKTSAMLPKEAGRTVDPEAGKRGAKTSGTGSGRWGEKPFKPGKPRFDRRSEGQDRGPAGDREDRRPQGRSGEGEDRRRAANQGKRRGYQDRGLAPNSDYGRRGEGRQDRGTARSGSAGPRRESSRGFGRPAENREGFGEGRSAQGRRSPQSLTPKDRRPENRGGTSRPSGQGERPFRGGRPQGTGQPRLDRPPVGNRPRRPEGGAEQGEGFEERRPFRPRGERPGGSGERPQRFGGKPSGRRGERPSGPSFGGGQGRGQGSGRGFGGRSEGGPAERPGKTGFKRPGQAGAVRSGEGRRHGSNGFKGKPGGRGPGRGPSRSGGSGRKHR